MSSFTYPTKSLKRKHGPQGYSRHESYRPWLRDEFMFRCVYCLMREQWGRVMGEFDIDHFLPQVTNPSLATNYDNLVFACARCNLVKSAQPVSDPGIALTSANLRMRIDGYLESNSEETEEIIETLDLNSPDMVSWRLLWVRIVRLARDNDRELHQRLMGFPENLPELSRLRPPNGNSRPNGITDSHFEKARRGELPATY